MERQKRQRSRLNLGRGEPKRESSVEGPKSLVTNTGATATPTDDKPTVKDGGRLPANKGASPFYDRRAPLSDSVKKMAAKADDYDAAFSALDDAGGFVRSLWISFVSLGTYLVVVVWSVTDKQLFLDTPIKLPLVDVSLPLYGFFLVAPLVFLVMHGYLLMQLVILANRFERYTEVISAVTDSATRRKLRRQLSSFVLIQFLSTSDDEPKGLFGYLLVGVAWLTVVVGPVFFFLLTQWRFLPYQDGLATWAHRLAIGLDLALLWALWSLVVRSGRGSNWPLLFGGLSTAAVLMLSVLILRFPGDFGEQFLPAAPNWVKGSLDLAELDVVDDEALAKIITRTTEAKLRPWEGERTFRINGSRNLRFADLHGADLRRSDLRNARLDNANLSDAKMEGALLDGATFDEADLTNTQLQGASLVETQIQHADLLSAQLQTAMLARARLQWTVLGTADLQGALLTEAQLQGASLGSAQLQGAYLWSAQLQGANLREAQLQGANLELAQLQGAFLVKAQLQGANLTGAQLQGASLVEADLQGANLAYAQIQGANFSGAKLQGASLVETELQGASLNGAHLQDAVLDNVFVFRTSIADVDLEGAAVDRRIYEGRVGRRKSANQPMEGEEELTDEIVQDWIGAATQYAIAPWGDEDRRAEIEQALGRLKKGGADADEDAAVTGFWIMAGNRMDAMFPVRLANRLTELACDRDNAPYIARELVQMWFIQADEQGLGGWIPLFKRTLGDRMKKAHDDPSKLDGADLSACPGLKGLTEEDWSDFFVSR